jgi:hypothetical protein
MYVASRIKQQQMALKWAPVSKIVHGKRKGDYFSSKAVFKGEFMHW